MDNWQRDLISQFNKLDPDLQDRASDTAFKLFDEGFSERQAVETAIKIAREWSRNKALRRR